MVSRSRSRCLLQLKIDFGGKCLDCGYDEVVDILVFHHVDPSTKEFSVGSISGRHNMMREEAKKCILLCPNCHAIRHL